MVIGMEEKDVLGNIEEQLFNMGREWAYEQIDPNKFKAKNNDEQKIFLKGYQQGIKEQSINNNDGLKPKQGRN